MFIRLQWSLSKITYEKHSSVNVKFLVRISYYSRTPLQFNCTARPHWLSLPSHIGFLFVNHPSAPPLYPEGFSRSHSAVPVHHSCVHQSLPFLVSLLRVLSCHQAEPRSPSSSAGQLRCRWGMMNLKSEVRGIPILGGACALPRPRATARAPRELRGACIFSFCATARMHTVGVGGVAYLFASLRFCGGI